MNKIIRKTASENGIDFNSLLEDFYCNSSEEHRRGSSFYRTSIVEISERWYPDLDRKLDGFWETNSYTWSDDDGYDKSEIYELTRVEKKTKTVVIEEWIKVKE